jgi:anti-sigma regulatory factor (Ser/Thr protein kinase)
MLDCTVTSNVLDWSRLESGEAICRPVAVDIRLACEAAVHVLPNHDQNTETELFVVVAPEVPQFVVVDERYLQRILMNILSNSFKFTASGYVTLLVRLTEGHVSLTVEDSGRGIPKSFLPQLFEPYKQAQARGAERGTGLGLSITKRLLERMGGSVAVESKYQQDQGVGVANSGGVFALTIPIATSERCSKPASLEPLKPLRIAIMHEGKHRDIEGLTAAWKSFGAEALHARTTTDISSDPDTIIWVDLSFLHKHHDICAQVLKQQQHMVLVPYKDPALLKEMLGLAPLTNVVPIRKPLLWHRIIQTIIDARQAQSAPDLDKDTTVASANDVMRISADRVGSRRPKPEKGQCY